MAEIVRKNSTDQSTRKTTQQLMAENSPYFDDNDRYRIRTLIAATNEDPKLGFFDRIINFFTGNSSSSKKDDAIIELNQALQQIASRVDERRAKEREAEFRSMIKQLITEINNYKQDIQKIRDEEIQREFNAQRASQEPTAPESARANDEARESARANDGARPESARANDRAGPESKNTNINNSLSEREKSLIALGFDKGATPTTREIKVAYRKQALIYHPDKQREEVKAAYVSSLDSTKKSLDKLSSEYKEHEKLLKEHADAEEKFKAIGRAKDYFDDNPNETREADEAAAQKAQAAPEPQAAEAESTQAAEAESTQAAEAESTPAQNTEADSASFGNTSQSAPSSKDSNSPPPPSTEPMKDTPSAEEKYKSMGID